MSISSEYVDDQLPKVRLNLGCGREYVEGYVNADRVIGDVDLAMDLNVTPYPFADESVASVRMRHVLEHLIDVKQALDDVWRVLIPAGSLEIWVPHFSHFQAMTHHEHRHSFHYNSLAPFTGEAGEPYTDRLWRMEQVKLRFSRRWQNWLFNRHKYAYTASILAYLFPAHEIYFRMSKARRGAAQLGTAGAAGL